MLIYLTNRCFANCSHCMNSSHPKGEHMDLDMVDDLCKFIKKVEPFIITITGGEFTEHPHFEYIINKILDTVKTFTHGVGVVTLLSNGMFITDPEKTEKIKRLLSDKRILFLQITTGEPYYSTSKLIEKNRQKLKSLSSKVEIFDFNRSLSPFGRALENHKQLCANSPRKPHCTNLYLLTKQEAVNNIKEMVQYLQKNTLYNKCKPLVDHKGFVRAGETINCEIIGNINDNLDEIFQRLLNGKPCNKCGLVKNIPIMARMVLER